MKKFLNLYESLSTIKQTKTIRYPKQINLSEDFIKSLKSEINRHLVIDESKEMPIRNLNEKLLKAINFHIIEHCGHCHKKVPVIVKKKKKRGPIVQGQTAMEYGTSQVQAGL